MNDTTMDAARAHAAAEYPREACGLVVIEKGKERFWPCRNMATDATEHFVLHPEDYAAAEDAGEVVSVVHSHPDAASRPSEQDRAMCEVSGLPWYIIGMPDGKPNDMLRLNPAGYVPPLVGRPFVHGLLDCWTLCRDWYAMEWGLALPSPPRADGWWDDGQSNLYGDAALVGAGFRVVWRKGESTAPPLQRGDLILMQVRSRNLVPNHAGVYLGDGNMLHHMHSRLSCREVFGGYWLETAVLAARHLSTVV
ncbi:C40 family peptidase [Dyella marensis]|uniref:Proteasome lid subunit RPN8/RPN11, contains Jab1/MPN metalloenzyme (JAMM) motif n=1 Tax=Dyella marensis TaxID=500610 RepID=A0A1I1ZXL9_9GAMM|nr:MULTISPECIES: C40 family peptidase [Dyella]SFE36237.1 Proteasome lid subunit RPN8/RPN11, contains Jab1/MPN metalloenzyme (JAMM) motif [Dyella marensis]